MYGTKGIARISLYPGKAYIEIEGQLYNRTALPQTFLWWANPAVAVNEHTQSIFPPDVYAVMDHGKRDVSRFPIATGVYYKKDYSEGVDISRYKNIPVSTSYMAEKSKYDFVGGYDYGKEAGILHIADHHISPGKKQWTWGCGDFGRAWDRNLTDEDGPYVELMTGIYTDNQPDFTWLKPFEEKTFKQYFMPYKAVGQVKNATTEAVVSLSLAGSVIRVIVYAASVFKNAHNIKARGLRAWLLKKTGKIQQALDWIGENLKLDAFDFVSGNELVELNVNDAGLRSCLNNKMRDFQENYLMAARDYAEWGAYKEALALLDECTKEYPMLYYYKAYYQNQSEQQKLPETVKNYLAAAEGCTPDYCFPNKLKDIAVLTFAIEHGCEAKATYYLGNLFYDKMQWEQSVALWEKSVEAEPQFPTAWRNLSLAYYNKRKDPARAKMAMEKAFALDAADVRIFLELDQLYKKLGWTFEERLTKYEAHKELVDKRDDLYIEYITLLNMSGNYEKAYECIKGRRFHPWEGGEGKITTQYTLVLLGMARKALFERRFKDAEGMLRAALVYPENLGEGKLEGTKDNHLYYHLGLAYQKLGRKKEAKARFYRLIDYGEQHLEEQVQIEYFAVSLPDLQRDDTGLSVEIFSGKFREQMRVYPLCSIVSMSPTPQFKQLQIFSNVSKLIRVVRLWFKFLSVLMEIPVSFESWF